MPSKLSYSWVVDQLIRPTLPSDFGGTEVKLDMRSNHQLQILSSFSSLHPSLLLCHPAWLDDLALIIYATCKMTICKCNRFDKATEDANCFIAKSEHSTKHA